VNTEGSGKKLLWMISRHYPGVWVEKVQENLIHDIQCPDRDSKLESTIFK
jgi:hypothetical protein